MGISLDELGIGAINAGSFFGGNVACIFEQSILQHHCSIVTDRE